MELSLYRKLARPMVCIKIGKIKTQGHGVSEFFPLSLRSKEVK
jgi:hypothetical protein